MKEKQFDFLFQSGVGSILCGALVLFLFIMTLGIGYLIMGAMYSNHEMKREAFHDVDPLGSFFLWPICILMRIFNY